MKTEKLTPADKKKILLDTIGEFVKNRRKELNKGILLLSYEYDIPNTSLAQLEKGKRDVQITTLWKLSEALGMKFPDFISEICAKLPENFKMLED